MNSARHALIAGASGLVGSHCLRALLASGAYASVHVLGRRPLPDAPDAVVAHVLDFEDLENYAAFPAVDDVFCCLGTPLNRINRHEAFYRVDYHYPRLIAEMALARGARHYALVTSSGIDVDSPLNYCRVKATLEEEIAAMGFESTHFFRPSLLLGSRSDRHPLQRLFGFLLGPVAPLFGGPLGPYRPVSAAAVGYAMAALAERRKPGVLAVASHEMHRLFKQRHAQG